MKNREIKFRAWNESAKRYSKVFGLESNILNYTDDDGLGIIKSLTSEVVEQYTVLKDKNGVEIYEGDVLRENYSPIGASPKTQYYHILKVSYSTIKGVGLQVVKEGFEHLDKENPYFIDEYLREKKGHVLYNDTYKLTNYPNSFEVIGNIHQNPELV